MKKISLFLVIAWFALALLPPSRAADEIDPGEPPLPEGAILRLGSTRFLQAGYLASVAYSPDGKLLAACGDETAVVLWNPVTGREVKRIAAGMARYSAVQFLPGTKGLLILDMNGIVHVWDPITDKEKLHFRLVDPVQERGFFRAAFLNVNRDGSKLLATGQNGKTFLGDLEKEQPIREIVLPGGRNAGPIFLGGGGAASYAWGKQDGSITFGNFDDGRQISTLPEKGAASGPITSLALSPDGKLLASCTANQIIIWDVATSKERYRWPVQGAIQYLTFSPNGQMLACLSHGQVALWGVVSGLELRRQPPSIEGFYQSVPGQPISFSPDGNFLAMTGRGQVRVWDLARDEMLFQDGPRGPMQNLRFTPDGKTLVGRDHVYRTHVFDATTGKSRGHIRNVMAMTNAAISPDGKEVGFMVAGISIPFYDLQTLRETRRFTFQEALAAQDRVLAGDGSKLLYYANPGQKFSILNLATGKQITGQHATYPNQGVVLFHSADGSRLGMGSFQGLTVYSARTGKPTAQLKGHYQTAHRAFGPGNWTAWMGGDRLLSLNEIATGAVRQKFTVSPNGATTLAFSPDGRVVALGEATGIRLVAIAGGQDIANLNGHRGVIVGLEFSPDGHRLVSSGQDSQHFIWDLRGHLAKLEKVRPATDPQELADLVASLDEPDGMKAFQAIERLGNSPGPVERLLAEKLQEPRPAKEVIARLIAELDANEFEAREKANRALAALGGAIEEELKKALATSESAEQKRRLETLLDGLKSEAFDRRRARIARSLEVLEKLATPAARRIVAKMAAEDESRWETEEAKAVLGRLKAGAMVR